MTLERLTAYADLIEKIKEDDAMIESLRTAAEPGAQRLTGMPHATGVKDTVGDFSVEIVYLQEHKKQLEAERDAEKPFIESYIASITDSRLNLIFRLRFEHACSWKAVATALGGRNTEDGVKSMCYRYLKHAPL